MSKLITVPAEQLSPRQRLLETAYELFYRHGINAVGIDRVLAESGVAKATLYRHFPTKDDLIVQVVRLRDSRYRAWLRQRVSALSPDPAGRPLAVFDAVRERCSDQDFRGCAFGNTIAEIADPAHPAHAAARENKQAVQRYLAELLTETGAADADLLATQLLLLLDGAVTTAIRDGSPEAADTARSIAGALIDRH